MNVEYSKDFRDSVKRLSGKMKKSVCEAIESVIKAGSLQEIPNLKKLVSYQYIYRLRIGNYRAFFTFHVQIINDTVMFQYILPRGEAYGKKNHENLKRKDI